MRAITYTKRISVIREDFGHEVEEVVVVFTKDDCLEGDLGQCGLECWREFALHPRFCRLR